MDKDINDAISEYKLNEWIFPHLHMEVKEEDIQEELQVETKVINAQEQNNRIAEEQLAAAKKELQEAKMVYENKINLLNDIHAKLEGALSVFDNEFIDLIQDIIKKSIKKVIYKEIKSDPKLLLKIVNELKSVINSQNGIVNVSLSEIDCARLKNDDSNTTMVINADPSLKEGDVVIKSNFAEIRSILNERIDKMIGLKNE